MSSRPLLAVPFLLCCHGLVFAQPPKGAEPFRSRPTSHEPTLHPNGAFHVSDLSIQKTSSGSDFVAITYQQTLTSPRVLGAFDYTRTGGLVARPDFNSIPANTEEITVNSTLTTAAYRDIGVGPRMIKRGSVMSPWGPPTQGNLANDCYGMQFFRSQGVNRLAAARSQPTPHIETYDFDENQLTVSNPVILTPPLGAPGNFVAFLIILCDEAGEARGILACIRQPLGFQQQFVFNASLDNSAPWLVFYTTPNGEYYTGGDQIAGGRCIVTNFAFGGSLPNGPVNLVGTFMFDTRTSILGGWTDATMMGAPGDLGVIGFGTALAPGVAIPGFDNLLGLAGLFLAATAWMPAGVGQVNMNLTPSASAFVVFMQGVSLSWSPNPNVFGNTAGFYAN